jgi:uncharacterized protein (TIGR02145 family)
MNYKSIVAVAVAVSAVVLIGCVCGGKGAKSTEAGDGTFTDSRDGKTYKTVKIGTAVWMAENLNFAADGSKCFENNDANCAKYGRLYDWATAMKACPAGYRLPSDDEWTALWAVGGGETAGKTLKSAAGWNENGNGTDDFGFSALPSGGGDSGGNFGSAGEYGFWWSATENDANLAKALNMFHSNENMLGSGDDKTNLYSVRCVKDGSGSTETATAQAAETPEGDDGSVDFGKLTLKGDVYYLNNKPFTGTAKKEDETSSETWEMKDGKFHGKYIKDEPNGSVTGYYKDGKKHGEWIEFHEPYDTYNKAIETYKDGKKHGEWKYIRVEQRWEGEEVKFIDHLIKTETWENDKLIGGMSNLDGIKLTYVAGNGKIKDFYIGTYEITQAQWLRWTILSSHFRGDNLPVETVNCDDVQKFLQRMNEKTGRNYRLPTEEEWEYAARGGNKSKGYKYSGSDNIDAVAWYEGNSGEKTHPVGTKQPNELGIYDMTGNVWEWTSTEGYIDGDTYRVMRGGCWGCDAEQNTVSHSTNSYPNDGGYALGFRVALDAEF